MTQWSIDFVLHMKMRIMIHVILQNIVTSIFRGIRLFFYFLTYTTKCLKRDEGVRFIRWKISCYRVYNKKARRTHLDLRWSMLSIYYCRPIFTQPCNVLKPWLSSGRPPRKHYIPCLGVRCTNMAVATIVPSRRISVGLYLGVHKEHPKLHMSSVHTSFSHLFLISYRLLVLFFGFW